MVEKYLICSVRKGTFLVMALLCHLSLLKTQSQVSLPGDIGLPLYHQPEVELVEKYNRMIKYDYESLSDASKDQYDILSTVYHLYILKEPSRRELDRALSRSKRRVCRILVGAHNNHKYRLEQRKITSAENWFLLDLLGEDSEKVLLDCQDFLDSLNRPASQKKEVMSTDIKLIEDRDRKYRVNGKVDWSSQNVLDSINRVKIDSIYATANSLEGFSEDEIFIFSLVVHHSNDCSWVYKWTERLINHSNNGYTGESLLGPLIERMLDAEDGYCTAEDPQKRDHFVYMIKKKYPAFVKRNTFSW